MPIAFELQQGSLWVFTKLPNLLHMAKLWFTIFGSCELLCRVYLQDPKIVNQNFAMYNRR